MNSIGRSRARCSLLLAVLIFVIYAGSIDSAWHMDDLYWIVQNPSVHVEQLSWNSVVDVAFSGSVSKDRLFRPLPMVSFALNWLAGKDSVTGYHLVNIAVHILTSVLLFWIIDLLFHTPVAGDIQDDLKTLIALAAATLWAVNPIHTQAVTYIVQRMAVMAALFYVLGIYCFIKGKLSTVRHRRILLYVACGISYLAALGSKENACLLPLSLILIDYVFFQPQSNTRFFKTRLFRRYLLMVGSGVFLAVLLLLMINKNPFDFLSQLYATRPFTLTERLMTEARVVVFYISQLFYPTPERLSIVHDLEMSTGLLNPLTTLSSVVTVLLLLGLSIWGALRKSVWGFALLFFFLNHLVESTILPLEPIFEHRNYLPSMFMFVPVAMVLQKALSHYDVSNKVVRGFVILFFILVLIGLGVGTHSRNQVWQTGRSLWTDALRKAPSRSRPYTNLAAIYKKEGRYDIALVLYEKSLNFEEWQGPQGKANTYNNIGNLYLELRHYEKAADYFNMALSLWPDHQLAAYNLAVCRQWQQDYRAAADIYESLIVSDPDSSLFIRRRAVVLQKMGMPDESLALTRRALQIQPHNPDIMLQLANLLSLNHHFDRARWYYERLIRAFPEAIKPHLHGLMNSLRWQDEDRRAAYTKSLFERFSRQTIRNGIDKIPYDIEQDYFINKGQIENWFRQAACYGPATDMQ